MSSYNHPFQEVYDILETNLPIFFPLIDKYISNEYMKELKDYLSHAEYGLLYENFCDIIIFYRIPITKETFSLIEKLGKLMKYEEAYWTVLKEFIMDY